MRNIIGKCLKLQKNKFTPRNINGKWERENSIIGHRPLFSIRCMYCDEEMFLRYSQILLRKTKLRGADKDCNQLAYKCPTCGNVQRFNVEDKRGYFKDILFMRKGVTLYYPPKDTWAKVSDLVRKRLENLGYC